MADFNLANAVVQPPNNEVNFNLGGFDAGSSSPYTDPASFRPVILRSDGVVQARLLTVASAGAVDAGKLVVLGSSGQLDSSFLPGDALVSSMLYVDSATTLSANRLHAINSTSGAFTCDMPASPSNGDWVAIYDFARIWAANNLTLGRNGNLFQDETGATPTEDFVMSKPVPIRFSFYNGVWRISG